MRGLAARLALVSGALVLGFLLLELGVRGSLAFDPNFLDEALVRNHHPAGRELTLLDLMRRHPDDRVVYELRPGTTGSFLGHPVRINSLGMRDRERSYEKPAGTVRIAALGDSHTFGWGVSQAEPWPAVLEDLLSERLPARRFEVWNFGVPGYNTVQEVRALELRLERVDPDVVVINYVDNDMDLPNFLAERPDLGSLRRSYLLELVRRRWAVFRNQAIWPAGLFGLVTEREDGRYRFPPEQIPKRFRPLSGWHNMTKAYERLARLGRAHGFAVVLLFNPDDYRPRLEGWSDDVRLKPVRTLGEQMRDRGYLVVDVQDRAFGHLETNGLDNRALWIRPGDSHSNPLRHRLVAEELLERLGGAGLLSPAPSDRS